MRLLMLAAGLSFAAAAPAYAAPARDYQAAIAVMEAYKKALASRDLSTADRLFAPDAQIFESGGVEGNFAHYRDHHLAPELKDFKSFAFRDYQASVRGEGDIAIVTEIYRYAIDLADGKTAERSGVTTSVLKWTDGAWRIINLHLSSRKPRPAQPS